MLVYRPFFAHTLLLICDKQTKKKRADKISETLRERASKRFEIHLEFMLDYWYSLKMLCDFCYRFRIKIDVNSIVRIHDVCFEFFVIDFESMAFLWKSIMHHPNKIWCVRGCARVLLSLVYRMTIQITEEWQPKLIQFPIKYAWIQSKTTKFDRWLTMEIEDLKSI